MNTSSVHTQDGVFKRVLLLYGLFMLLSNAAFLVGYYLLPEGFLRGSPMQAGASAVAATTTFWSQVGSTFLFNIGALIAGCVWLNLFQFKGFPLGYLGLIIRGNIKWGGCRYKLVSHVQYDTSQCERRYGC